MNDYLPCYHAFPGWDGGLLNAPAVVWNLILSDLGVFTAYIIIAWGLMRYATQRDSPFKDITILFSLFIGFCGISHAVKIAVLFIPAFWAEAVVQWLTFNFSIAAAAVWFFKYKDMVDYSSATEAMRKSFLARQKSLLERLEKIEREIK